MSLFLRYSSHIEGNTVDCLFEYRAIGKKNKLNN